jgi:murein DD-endopeptidase MepM/ murein hydrolase activator NlpD
MSRRLAWLTVLVGLAALGAVWVFVVAGRTPPPALSIDKPEHIVGQQGTLEVSATGTQGRLSKLTVALEQNGRTFPLLSIDAAAAKTFWRPDTDRVSVIRQFGKQSVPELQEGAARLVVNAATTSWLNLRTVSSQISKDIQVRLEPPRLAVLSTHHYVNHGGSEMVVYRATPADVESGVRVGDIEYAGFPAAGAGVANADPTVKVAFFALLHDQDLSTPIVAFARDPGGPDSNEVKTTFVDKVFEKPVKRSRIEVDDRFLGRVVPEILEHSPQLKVAPNSEDLLPAFLKINGELRRMNTDEITSIAEGTAPARLWSGPFVQLGNSQVEAAFADHRTYIYKGKEVDQQVHLGFDLAVTAKVPVVAANAGKVLSASWLGIFGNCVIIDHGMGVASLYGHLSSFDVKVGDSVTRGQTIARSGMTGLASGDHLHFTMLVSGHPVNPVEWWDSHWIEDRVERKLHDLGGVSTPAPATPPRAALKATQTQRRKAPGSRREGR